MSEKSLFQKVCDREIPADIVYEDEHCVCFRDIQPAAPTHLLLVPRKHIERIAAATADDAILLGHMMTRISGITAAAGLDDGFRVVINNGSNGGEIVPHLHIHILGGRKLEWPPG